MRITVFYLLVPSLYFDSTLIESLVCLEGWSVASLRYRIGGSVPELMCFYVINIYCVQFRDVLVYVFISGYKE